MREGLAIREHRILAYRRRHRDIMKFLRKRGGNPALGGVIGDPSGFFIGRERILRLGKKSYVKTLDIKLDTAIAKELSKIERAIAIETGQWKTNPNWPSKVEHYERAIPLADLFSPAELDRARARAERSRLLHRPKRRPPGLPDQPRPTAIASGPQDTEKAAELLANRLSIRKVAEHI